mmetsp:Transcript_9262/g.20600  ORF Transcript_9262/g.20600 Transcript_9262/m.20600 type:complete len:244 (-) Transcript_9262:179-910(-)
MLTMGAENPPYNSEIAVFFDADDKLALEFLVAGCSIASTRLCSLDFRSPRSGPTARVAPLMVPLRMCVAFLPPLSPGVRASPGGSPTPTPRSALASPIGIVGALSALLLRRVRRSLPSLLPPPWCPLWRCLSLRPARGLRLRLAALVFAENVCPTGTLPRPRRGCLGPSACRRHPNFLALSVTGQVAQRIVSIELAGHCGLLLVRTTGVPVCVLRAPTPAATTLSAGSRGGRGAFSVDHSSRI